MKFVSRILYEIIHWPLLVIWRLMGWRTEPLPDVPKMVLIAAPHTSNWDFFHAIMTSNALRRRLNVTVKHTLFFPPLGWFLKAVGGVPINREKPGNIVKKIANSIKEADRMMMVFTPEGTRSKREYWKTGFYWTALEAGVPIVVASPNYKEKVVYISEAIMPSGDIEADFEIIKAHQEAHGYGLFPERANDLKLRPRARKEETAEAEVEVTA
jgi:1-acyl-sn-glycerol-3-phosphate acyltransferase